MTPESEYRDTQLFCAVINQALADIVSVEKKYLDEQRKARNWFQDDGADFRYVCQLAGMDHEKIRAYALKKIAEADADTAPKGPRMIEHNGECLSRQDWSRRLGINISTISARLKSGCTVEQALTPGKRSPARKLYTHDGKSHTLDEWAKIAGIKPNTIEARIAKGWSLADALTLTKEEATKRRLAAARARIVKRPGAKAKLHTHNGMSKPLQQWADHYGLKLNTLHARLKQGWTLERAFTTPSRQAAKNETPTAQAA